MIPDAHDRIPQPPGSPYGAREPRLIADWEATARGARRLQILQVVVLVVLGALAIATVVGLGGQIVGADEDREARGRDQATLVALREGLREVQVEFWKGRADGRAGTPPQVALALQVGRQAAAALAARLSERDLERLAASRRVLAAFDGLNALAAEARDIERIGTPADVRAIALSEGLIDRLEEAMQAWVQAEGAAVAAADRRARELTETLVGWMVGLILGIAASALALGLVLGRARRRLDQALRRATRRQAALADSSRRFAEAGGEPAAVVAALDATVGEVVGDVGAVRLVDRDAPLASVPAAAADDDPFARVIRAGAPYVADGVESSSAPELARAGNGSVRGLALVPMRARGRVLGALGAIRTEGDAGYAEDDLLFLQELADRAAAAIDGAALARQASRAQELERIGRFKTSFLAKASHELRTPLAAIIGYSELLAEQDPEVAELYPSFARTILDSGRHLREVVDDLLDLQRIETGDLRLDLKAVDLRAIVTQACRAVAPLAEAKGIELESDLAPESVMVVCDDGRLHQVLMNLLSNAVKFTDRGAIVASAWRRDTDGVATVRDTGRGIPAADLPLIWHEFHQVGGDDGGVAGSGLGLAIARRLVQMQSGDIACSSTVGVGTTFTVRLPGTG